MILEIDTNVIKYVDNITINQLMFLTLVLNDYQKNHQDVLKLLSLVPEEEIQELVNRNLLSVKSTDDATVYEPSEYLTSLVVPKKSMFDEFYDLFPVCVIRPDGLKTFLRTNVNKCRQQYNKIVGRSRAMHEHLCKCLNYEVSQKTVTGNLSYMKTMWKWLTQHEWESYDEEMMYAEKSKDTEMYGTTVY